MNPASQIRNLLLASSVFSILLYIARYFIFGSMIHAYLVWNLFLAWIPFITARALYSRVSKVQRVLFFAIWLLFLPNSPYIITDLVHLHQDNGKALFWFDLMMIVSFAWNGLLLGFVSLMQVHSYLHRFFRKRITWSFIYVILFLCSYGVYLGRFERYNSWDIVVHPLDIIYAISSDFLNPADNINTFGITFIIALFLTLAYLTLATLKNPGLLGGDETKRMHDYENRKPLMNSTSASVTQKI